MEATYDVVLGGSFTAEAVVLGDRVGRVERLVRLRSYIRVGGIIGMQSEPSDSPRRY